MVTARLWTWCAVLALPLVACGTEANPLQSCPAAVEMTISSGPQPLFDWTPRCLGATLIVEARDGSGATMWILQTVDQENRLSPPIRYGDKPEGTEQIGDRLPLLDGSLYLVGLAAVHPRSNGGIIVEGVGEAEFQH